MELSPTLATNASPSSWQGSDVWILYGQLFLLVALSFFVGCGLALVAIRARLGSASAEPVEPAGGTSP